jgi:hypothetical protein
MEEVAWEEWGAADSMQRWWRAIEVRTGYSAWCHYNTNESVICASKNMKDVTYFPPSHRSSHRVWIPQQICLHLIINWCAGRWHWHSMTDKMACMRREGWKIAWQDHSQGSKWKDGSMFRGRWCQQKLPLLQFCRHKSKSKKILEMSHTVIYTQQFSAV